MATISIKYHKSADDIIYDGISIRTLGGIKEYATGDLVKDWIVAHRDYYENIKKNDSGLSYSSSVDHFIMDGAKYDSAYLHYDESSDSNELRYLDESVPDYLHSQQHIYRNGIEIFVDEGTTPTWVELKRMKNLS